MKQAMAWCLFLCVFMSFGCATPRREMKAYQVEVSDLSVPPFSLAILLVDRRIMVSTKGLLGGMDPLPYFPAENLRHEGRELTFATSYGVIGKLFPLQWSARILSTPDDDELKIELTDKNLADGKNKRIYILRGIDPREIDTIDPEWRAILGK